MEAQIDTGRPEPCPDEFNLAAYVLEAGRRTPDKVALAIVGASGARRISYAQLLDMVRIAAAGLRGAGLGEGERVVLRIGNTVNFPVFYLGAIAIGAVPVLTSPQLTAPEVEKIFDLLKPRMIVAEAGIAVPPEPKVPVLGVEALRGDGTLAEDDFLMGAPDRPAYVTLTSGTASTPRAVLHAHRAVWARRMMWRDWYGLTSDDRLLHAGSFNWTFTLGTGLLDPWAIGATALIPAPDTAPEALPLLLKRFDATIFAAAPGVYRRILRRELPEMSRLRHGLTAGEKMPEQRRSAWQQATGRDVHEAFGMSECSTFISGCPARPAPAGTLGFPQEGRRVAILGDGSPVQRGEVGTIAISADDPGLMLGYLGANGPSSGHVVNRWFPTGDQGIMENDGSIRYMGRADDMLNAGGFRVSPLEIEDRLSAFPGIAECAAIEVEVAEGTRVIALCYAGAGPVDETDLARFAETCLARYKQPRIYRRLPELPRGGNNKILRRALRDAFQVAKKEA